MNRIDELCDEHLQLLEEMQKTITDAIPPELFIYKTNINAQYKNTIEEYKKLMRKTDRSVEY